jgi:hypothetical protein
LEYEGQFHLPVPAIEDVKPISRNSYVFKSYDTGRHQSELFKIVEDSNVVRPEVPLLERQLDGHFCTDGKLLFSSASHRLVYVYYYRNQYICFDTSLNLLYRGRTIDTNTVAKINLDTVKINNNQQTVIFKSPPLSVNKNSCLYDNRLFIQSLLPASNEDATLLREISAIDVYDLYKRKYRFSFYIPDFKGNKPRQFQVYGNGVAVLYDRYLAIFSLNPDVFK